MSAENAILAGALVELRAEQESLRAQLKEAEKAIAATEDRARSLLQERERLQESLSLANSRLSGEARPPVLSAAEVSSLVDRLLANLAAQLHGLTVREGELRLNVGFEKVGEQAGFVFPSSDSASPNPEHLHSISIRLTPESDR